MLHGPAAPPVSVPVIVLPSAETFRSPEYSLPSRLLVQFKLASPPHAEPLHDAKPGQSTMSEPLSSTTWQGVTAPQPPRQVPLRSGLDALIAQPPPQPGALRPTSASIPANANTTETVPLPVMTGPPGALIRHDPGGARARGQEPDAPASGSGDERADVDVEVFGLGDDRHGFAHLADREPGRDVDARLEAEERRAGDRSLVGDRLERDDVDADLVERRRDRADDPLVVEGVGGDHARDRGGATVLLRALGRSKEEAEAGPFAELGELLLDAGDLIERARDQGEDPELAAEHGHPAVFDVDAALGEKVRHLGDQARPVGTERADHRIGRARHADELVPPARGGNPFADEARDSVDEPARARSHAPVDTSALERAIAGADGRAILVEQRVLRRVIKRKMGLPGIGVTVPHAGCFAIDRDALLDLASLRELGGRTRDGLADEVVLLPRPDPGDPRGDAETLRAMWRDAFHARVHLAIAREIKGGSLTKAAVAERIHRLGHTEFDEARIVLRQEDRLLSTLDEREAWTEFAATYLELRHFEPELVARMFPVLLEPAAVDALLAEDVDVTALLEASRPAGAGSPVAESVAAPSSRQALPPPVRDASARPGLVARAESASKKGNRVRAALSRLAAAGCALPDAAEAVLDRAAARAELEALAGELAAALGGADDAGGPAAWADAFEELAARAVHGALVERTVEARALFDVQAACLEAERVPKTVELMPFLRSFGKKPIVRTLLATREVRIARRLRAAADRAARGRLPAEANRRIGELFHVLRTRADRRLREALRPRIAQSLTASGLAPASAVQRAALHTIVEQLLDVVADRGFLGIGQLRDALSRHDLKLPNLTPKAFVVGDALLKADRRLDDEIDGVYRSGEVYLRGLQRLSSVAFGTRFGRVLTLYAILPLLISFVALEGMSHLLSLVLHLAGFKHHVHLLNVASFTALAAFVFAMLHSPLFVRAVWAALRGLGWALHGLFVRLPRRIAALPWVQRILRDRTFRAFDRYVVRPAIVATVLDYATPMHRARATGSITGSLLVFVATSLVANSPLGVAAEEATVDWASRRVRWLRVEAVPGLIHVISSTFGRVLESIERAIYAVDEFIRFREGENPALLAAKVLLGFVWFFVAYVLRLYTNLLIEPQVNPIKHFPVVTVAHKICLPIDPVLYAAIEAPLASVVPRAVASTFAAVTVFAFPGVFGFLVWELSANFRLYAQNRSRALEPVMIGHHGETMARLLRPGIHSGTIPKLFAKLRKAAQTEDNAAVGAHNEALHEVGEAIERFLDRELVGLLEESPAWRWGALEVSEVELAASRVRIRIALCREPGGPVERAPDDELVVHFEEQSGYLCAGIPRAGFVDALPAEGRLVIENAIAGLYRLAGASLSREAVEREIEGAAYDISEEGLVVWPVAGYRSEVVYDLARGPILEPHVRGEPLATPPKTLDRRRLLLSEAPLYRDAWETAWDLEAPPRLFEGASILPRREGSSIGGVVDG